MSILSGISKIKKYIKTSSGYKLLSQWTSSNTVEMDDGTTLQDNQLKWDDKYTKNEIDNKFSTLETNIDWKESVETFDDIENTYPSPEDGWTVNVQDTDYTYRWNGSEWVAISANAIPKATQMVDGLLSKEDKTLYDDANAKKHMHENKTALDGITSEQIEQWNAFANSNVTGVKGNAETNFRTGDINLTPENIGLGNVGNFKAVSTVVSQGLSDTEKSNARTNIGAGTSSFSGSYSDLSDKPAIPTVTNSLTSSSVINALSAKQGKVLSEYLSNTVSKSLSSGSSYLFQNADVRFGSIIILYSAIGGTTYMQVYVVNGSNLVTKIYESANATMVTVSVSNNKVDVLMTYPGYTLTVNGRIIY